MTVAMFLSIFLSGVSLAMDAFAVSVCNGMVYTDLDRRKTLFMPLVYALFQALMPIIGFYIGMAVSRFEAFDSFDHWIAFALLVIIGGNMLLEGIKDYIAEDKEITPKKFSVPEVLVQGVATSIDALFVGFSFTTMLAGASNLAAAAWISVGIIGVTTFAITFVGVMLGKKIGALFRKKTCIAQMIGGVVLWLIAVKIVLSGYGVIPF